MDLIYLDLETIPTQQKRLVDYIGHTVKPPGNMKKPETIAKWEAEEGPDAVLDAVNASALDGCFNHIVCIGYAFNNEPVETLLIEDVSKEKDMLSHFYNLLLARHNGFLAGKTFVGHNISGFDMRVLRHRSIILGVKPPQSIPFDSKPWDKNPYDTMVQWDARNFVKLDKIAAALGIPGKGAFSGSDVYTMWQIGEYALLREYCAADVELTRQIYKRMQFLTPPEPMESESKVPKRLLF